VKPNDVPRPRVTVDPTSERSPSDREARLHRIPLRFIRLNTVRDRTGLSRSTIWRLERRGDFPKHRRISLNAVGWLEAEVDEWVLSRERAV
jgi:prophage regulatory protein